MPFGRLGKDSGIATRLKVTRRNFLWHTQLGCAFVLYETHELQFPFKFLPINGSELVQQWEQYLTDIIYSVITVLEKGGCYS
jgi:hypothetical protein